MEVSDINAAIARAMGESQVTRYVVKNKSDKLVMGFRDGNVETREEAEAWIKQFGHVYPDDEGLCIESELAWPDYMNMTKHAARFLNWGIKRLPQDQFGIFENVSNSINFQQWMVSALHIMSPNRKHSSE